MDQRDIFKVKMQMLQKQRTSDLVHAQSLIRKKNRTKTPYYYKLSCLVEKINDFNSRVNLNPNNSLQNIDSKHYKPNIRSYLPMLMYIERPMAKTSNSMLHKSLENTRSHMTKSKKRVYNKLRISHALNRPNRGDRKQSTLSSGRVVSLQGRKLSKNQQRKNESNVTEEQLDSVLLEVDDTDDYSPTNKKRRSISKLMQYIIYLTHYWLNRFNTMSNLDYS